MRLIYIFSFVKRIYNFVKYAKKSIQYFTRNEGVVGSSPISSLAVIDVINLEIIWFMAFFNDIF